MQVPSVQLLRKEEFTNQLKIRQIKLAKLNLSLSEISVYAPIIRFPNDNFRVWQFNSFARADAMQRKFSFPLRNVYATRRDYAS